MNGEQQDNPTTHESTGLSRRQIFGIGAGLGVLGAAAWEGGHASAADGHLGADGSGRANGAGVPNVVPPVTPGVKYVVVGIFDFFTNNNVAREFVGGVYPTTTAYLVSSGLKLPVGAVITEFSVWAKNTAAGALPVELRSYRIDGAGGTDVATATIPAGTPDAPSGTGGAVTSGVIIGTEATVLADRQYSVEANVEGTGATQKLYGVRIGYTGGPSVFTPISPVRAYDSRMTAYPVNGVLARNSSRVISIKDGHDAIGAVNLVDAVPAGATAVTYNLTATGTTGPNFLAVTPGDATTFTASAINFGTGESVANGGVIKLDASRQVKVWCGDQTGSTHVIIDITGYYL